MFVLDVYKIKFCCKINNFDYMHNVKHYTILYILIRGVLNMLSRGQVVCEVKQNTNTCNNQQR